MTRTWRCRLGIHRYRKVWDHEKSRELKECRDCGSRTGTGFPAAPIG